MTDMRLPEDGYNSIENSIFNLSQECSKPGLMQSIFYDLQARTNFTRRSIRWNGDRRYLEPGQCFFSLREMAKRHGASHVTVKKYIELIGEHVPFTLETSKAKGSGGHIITWKNWRQHTKHIKQKESVPSDSSSTEQSESPEINANFTHNEHKTPNFTHNERINPEVNANFTQDEHKPNFTHLDNELYTKFTHNERKVYTKCTQDEHKLYAKDTDNNGFEDVREHKLYTKCPQGSHPLNKANKENNNINTTPSYSTAPSTSSNPEDCESGVGGGEEEEIINFFKSSFPTIKVSEKQAKDFVSTFRSDNLTKQEVIDSINRFRNDPLLSALLTSPKGLRFLSHRLAEIEKVTEEVTIYLRRHNDSDKQLDLNDFEMAKAQGYQRFLKTINNVEARKKKIKWSFDDFKAYFKPQIERAKREFLDNQARLVASPEPQFPLKLEDTPSPQTSSNGYNPCPYPRVYKTVRELMAKELEASRPPCPGPEEEYVWVENDWDLYGGEWKRRAKYEKIDRERALAAVKSVSSSKVDTTQTTCGSENRCNPNGCVNSEKCTHDSASKQKAIRTDSTASEEQGEKCETSHQDKTRNSKTLLDGPITFSEEDCTGKFSNQSAEKLSLQGQPGQNSISGLRSSEGLRFGYTATVSKVSQDGTTPSNNKVLEPLKTDSESSFKTPKLTETLNRSPPIQQLVKDLSAKIASTTDSYNPDHKETIDYE